MFQIRVWNPDYSRTHYTCTAPLESPAILICPESAGHNIVLKKIALNFNHLRALLAKTILKVTDSGLMRIAGDSRGHVAASNSRSLEFGGNWEGAFISFVLIFRLP